MPAELDNAVGTGERLYRWDRIMRTDPLRLPYSYVPSIDGVLVSFVWPPEILQRNAPLAPSSAYTLIHARWTGTVFRPQIGAKTSTLSSYSLFIAVLAF